MSNFRILGLTSLTSLRRKRNQRVIQIESFGYDFSFAFGMALVRAEPGSWILVRSKTSLWSMKRTFTTEVRNLER